MKQTLTVEISDDTYASLQRESERTGVSLERLAADWLSQHARRGKVQSLMPFFGGWQMSAEERASIEQLLEKERHMERGAA